jgi:hypothetical protein
LPRPPIPPRSIPCDDRIPGAFHSAMIFKQPGHHHA